jgi:NAD+ kinase
VRRIAVAAHGSEDRVGPALEWLHAFAAAEGVEIGEEDADLAVVLGGDGTILRTLHRFLGTDVPVIGVNFGRVGFLSSIRPEEMESGLRRAFAGGYVVQALPTLEVVLDGSRAIAVNDVVCASSVVGRMVELAWCVGEEELGVLPCDGVICATPSGSTAYNLSGGGPVLVWGLDALVVTFVSPHSLHARPLVVPRDLAVTVRNSSREAPATVIVDGVPLGQLDRGCQASIRLAPESSLLATLPEVTFLRRYSETFAS